MARTFQPLPIRPRHLLRLVGGAFFALALAGCSSDGGTDDAATTSEVDEATTTTEATTVPPETDPPETDPPTDDSGSDESEAIGSDADICSSYDDLQALLEELEEPNADTDFEAVWASVQETAADMTSRSPAGYEDELSRMEHAWGEFLLVAREYDYNMDDAEDDFDLISANLGLDRPEILRYLSTECT